MELCKLIEENGTNVEFHLMLLELNKSLYGGRIQVAPFESTMKGQIHLNDLFNLNRGVFAPFILSSFYNIAFLKHSIHIHSVN